MRRRCGMSDYIRPKVTGATIFFTVALQHRGQRLLVDEIQRLREAVAVTKSERPFQIDAWVVLPDHMHCVWTMPAGDREYGTRMGAIKSRFTRSLGRVGFHPTAPAGKGVMGLETEAQKVVGWNPTLRSPSKVAKGDAGVWQRRFWEHHIRDEADFAAHVRYCWVNPVKHGFVERPEDWPFSSVHREMAAGVYGG